MKLAEEKVVIVTGAARGIGKGIAEVFGEHGAYVIVADVKDDDAKKVVESIQASGGKEGLAVHLDVTDPQNVKQMVDQIIQKFGR